MSAPPEQSEARKRAEARKAKILARGNTGLNKLASTARGEEASTLYDTSSSSRPSTPVTNATSVHLPSQPARTTSSLNSSQQDPSAEYNRQLEQMMSMLSGGAPPPGSVGPGGPGAEAAAFQAMMAQMLGGAGGGPNPFGSENLLTDVDPTADPPSPTLPSTATNPFDLSSLPPNLFPPGSASPPQTQQPKSLIERIFPLIHVFSILAFWAFVVLMWEPSVRTARGGQYLADGRPGGDWGVFLGRGVAGSVARAESLAALPVFWAFTTLELILQTTRFMILKVPPPSPSFLTPLLPLLPPQLSSPILAVLRYVHLGNQVWKDGCLLGGLFGVTVMLAGRGMGPPSV